MRTLRNVAVDAGVALGAGLDGVGVDVVRSALVLPDGRSGAALGCSEVGVGVDVGDARAVTRGEVVAEETGEAGEAREVGSTVSGR